MKSKVQYDSTTPQSEWLSPRIQKTINTGEDTGGKEPSHTIGSNVNNNNATKIPQNTKHRSTI